MPSTWVAVSSAYLPRRPRDKSVALNQSQQSWAVYCVQWEHYVLLGLYEQVPSQQDSSENELRRWRLLLGE